MKRIKINNERKLNRNKLTKQQGFGLHFFGEALPGLKDLWHVGKLQLPGGQPQQAQQGDGQVTNLISLQQGSHLLQQGPQLLLEGGQHPPEELQGGEHGPQGGGQHW